MRVLQLYMYVCIQPVGVKTEAVHSKVKKFTSLRPFYYYLQKIKVTTTSCHRPADQSIITLRRLTRSLGEDVRTMS